MFSDSFDRLMTLFATGLGLALLGCVNAFLRQSPLAIRGAISLAVIAVMTGVTFAATGRSESGAIVGLALAGLVSVVLLCGSPWLGRLIAALASAVRAPTVRWAVVGVLGLATAIGSVLQSESEHLDSVDQQMAELEAMTSPPPCEIPSIRAVTDFGSEIAIREATALGSDQDMLLLESAIFSRPALRDSVIRCQPGSDQSNCHGWVFTGGRFWVSGSEIDRILSENAYQTVTDPRPADLVIYRDGTNVVHTALVRYVTPGLPVLVEGKWGRSGIYLHPVDKSIYGTSFQYYRSTRSGHLLAGLHATEGNGARGNPQSVPDPAKPDEFTE